MPVTRRGVTGTGPRPSEAGRTDGGMGVGTEQGIVDNDHVERVGGMGSPPAPSIALAAEGLAKSYGATRAVVSASIRLPAGRIVGMVGETRGELNPEGSVHVKGTLWRGRSADGSIPAGTRVRVRGVDGLVLRVTPEPPDEAAGPDPSPGS